MTRKAKAVIADDVDDPSIGKMPLGTNILAQEPPRDWIDTAARQVDAVLEALLTERAKAPGGAVFWHFAAACDATRCLSSMLASLRHVTDRGKP